MYLTRACIWAGEVWSGMISFKREREGDMEMVVIDPAREKP